MVKVTWPQALAWRMRRQLLDPVGRESAHGVVRRLCAVQAQVASYAELAVRVRRQSSKPGDVARALSEGRLIKTWAMRGTLHYLTPEDGGVFLSLIASGKSWERPSWQAYFGMTTDRMARLRVAVRQALDGRVLTREELVNEIVATRGLRHIGEELRSGWGTLLKPLAWQGDLCFGPSRGSRVTFMQPEAASARWGGVPEPEAAGPAAVAAYVGAYGPASVDGFGAWLAGGWFGTRKMRSWFEVLGDRLVEVDVDGDRAFVLAEDVDGLVATSRSRAVRLLPGFDQWVLGPGTKDPHVIPPGRRTAVSKQSGWIAAVVVAGGVVSGTWELEGDEVRVGWFPETGRVPRRALGEEAARLGSVLGRDLEVTVGPS